MLDVSYKVEHLCKINKVDKHKLEQIWKYEQSRSLQLQYYLEESGIGDNGKVADGDADLMVGVNYLVSAHDS